MCLSGFSQLVSWLAGLPRYPVCSCFFPWYIFVLLNFCGFTVIPLPDSLLEDVSRNNIETVALLPAATYWLATELTTNLLFRKVIFFVWVSVSCLSRPFSNFNGGSEHLAEVTFIPPFPLSWSSQPLCCARVTCPTFAKIICTSGPLFVLPCSCFG